MQVFVIFVSFRGIIPHRCCIHMSFHRCRDSVGAAISLSEARPSFPYFHFLKLLTRFSRRWRRWGRAAAAPALKAFHRYRRLIDDRRPRRRQRLICREKCFWCTFGSSIRGNLLYGSAHSCFTVLCSRESRPTSSILILTLAAS